MILFKRVKVSEVPSGVIAIPNTSGKNYMIKDHTIESLVGTGNYKRSEEYSFEDIF